MGIFGDEALINGKWYKAGDKVADAKILAVNPIHGILDKLPNFETITASDISSNAHLCSWLPLR